MIIIATLLAITAGLWVFVASNRGMRRHGRRAMIRWPVASVAGFVVCVLAFGIGGAIVMPSADDEPVAKTEPTAQAPAAAVAETPVEQPQPEAPKVATLGFTSGHLLNQIKRNLKRMDQPPLSGEQLLPAVGDDGSQALRASINPFVAITGGVAPGSHQLKALMIIGSGDGTALSGAHILVGFTAVVASLDGVDQSSAGVLVTDLVPDDANERTRSMTRAGYDFEFVRTEQAGTWITVSRAG